MEEKKKPRNTLEVCTNLKENEHDKITVQDIFETDTEKLKIIANRIIQKNDQINNKIQK